MTGIAVDIRPLLIVTVVFRVCRMRLKGPSALAVFARLILISNVMAVAGYAACSAAASAVGKAIFMTVTSCTILARSPSHIVMCLVSARPVPSEMLCQTVAYFTDF